MHREPRQAVASVVRVPRGLAALVAVVLSASLVVVVQSPPALAAGTPDITLTKSAPSSVLAGTPITYTLTATSPAAGVPGYNLTFRDVLPSGVAYVAGSTSPSGAGEPTVLSNLPTPGLTTLVWPNVSDLFPGGSQQIAFQVMPSGSTFPVNANVSNTADAYVHTDPRTVPTISSSTGQPVAGTYTGSDSAGPTSTTVTALQVGKAMPSPENELVRGVHGAFPQVWTLTVTNNPANATNATTVVDYIPANLEFLGCGGVDNTPGGVEEYPGSGGLTSVPVISTGCPTPTNVSTVQNPAGLPAGVYTRVEWSTGNLAPGQVVTIRYKAGAPLRANTFPGPAGPDTANLGNNTGASTTETATERSATNTAVASGTYTGPVAGGTSTTVSAQGSLTVSLEDFAVDKGPSGSFQVGTIVEFSLRIRTGEYRDLTGVTLVDRLPSGLCPLGPANYALGTPAECDPVPGQNPSIPYSPAPTVNGDGSTDVPFAVGAVPADSTTTVTFPARMRATYTGGDPTVAADQFTNTVSGSATSVPTSASPDPAPPVTVTDDSSSTLVAGGPLIDKQVSQAVAPPGTMDCATATYVDPTASPDTRPGYAKGDRVCFKLRVSFPASVQTRNPNVIDFLPPGMSYEAGSASPTAANTVAMTLDDSAAGSGRLDWTIGAGGPPRFVARAAVFEVTFAGIVDVDAGAGQPFDLLPNLMKFRGESTTGQVYSLRDEVELKALAGPRLSILKGVAGIAPPYGNGPNVDNVAVRAGTVVRFRLDITNNGSTPAQSTQVRDVLPAGITCADVSAISNGGTCQPSSGGITTPVVVWNLPAGDVITAGATRAPLTYDVTIPATVSAGRSFTNTAGVTQYDSPTNRGGTTTWVPTNNIDPAATPTANTPQARDTSRVFTPAVTLAKTHTTSVTETGNSATQATIGETVRYTLTTTVPAGTTVYDGLLVDPIPAGQAYVAGSATATLDGGPLPGGFTVTGGAIDARLAFPATYSNAASPSARVFVLTFQATVLDNPANVRGANRRNTGTFTSNLTAGGTANTPVVAFRDVPVVEPNLAVTKTNNAPGGVVVSGQTFTWTVTLRNTAGTGVSIAHDTTLTDVVPAGLTFVAGSASGGGTYDGPSRTLSWVVGDIAPGASVTRTFQVTVDPGAVSGLTYTNTATGVTTSMPGVVPGERSYTRNGSNTVTVQRAQTTKSVLPGTATIGETVQFTVTTTVPRDVRLYDATIVDTLPTGLTYVSTDSATCSVSPCPATTPPTFRQNGQRVGWYFGDPAVASAPYTLTVTFTARVSNVPSNVNGVVRTNTGVLRWGTVDRTFPPTGLPADSFWNQVSNSATASVTVVEPALVLAKTVDQPGIAPGQTRTFTLRLTNNGTSPAYAATVSDPIPNLLVVDGTSFVGPGTATLTGAGPTGGGTVSWAVPGPIASGASVTLSYTATLAPSASVPDAQVLTNTATLSSYAGLPGGPGAVGRPYTGNSSAATVTAAFPDVVIAKTTSSGAETGSATIGTSFGWRLVLTNTSSVPAYALSAVDTLPANWTYDTGSATLTPQGGPTTQVDPSIAGQTLTWATALTLAPGQTLTIAFTATPGPGVTTDPGVGPANPHVNSATPGAQDATGATGNASGPYGGPADTATAYVDSADLRIDKSHTGSFTAGTDGSYTITVTNDGPSAAGGPLTVTDTLPAGFTFVSGGAANGWAACTASGQVVTCTRAGGLAAGASTDFSLVVAVASGQAAGSYDNVASVSGPTHDPNPTNNTDTDPTPVITRADLAIDKEISGAVVAGTEVTWTLRVTNNGPSVSRAPITVTDTLPAGTTYVSALGTDWSCSHASGTVTCTYADDLGPAAAAPEITLVVALASTASGTLSNTASVAGTTTDPVPGNDSDTEATPIDRSADLTLTKSHTGDFLAGGTGTYQILVTNQGPSSAAGPLTVTDTLPGPLSFAGDGGQDGWSCTAAGQDVTCTRAAGLAVGADTSFTIDVDVASDLTGAVRNTATVSSPTPDPDTDNDTDDDDTGVSTEADLSVTKTHTPDPVPAGDQVTYTLRVHNAGASDAAPDVVLVDTLPAGLSVASVSADAGWSCPFSVGDTALTCTRSTALAAGADASVVVTVDVDPAQPAGTVINRASVGSTTTPDPDTSNNTTTDPTQVVTEADLVLAKTADDSSVAAGGQTSFTISVRNAGPSDAAAPVTVVDTLPAGTSFVSGGGSGGWAACSAAGLTVTCARASVLAAGATAADLVITVQVLPGTAAGTLANSATVSSPTTDPDSDDNTDDATVDVSTSADLSLVKTHRESPVLAGGLLTFDLRVHNAGPSDAAAPLEVGDTLPAKVRYVSVAAPWTCTASGDPLVGQQLDCTLLAGLAADGDAPDLTLTTSVDPDLAPGTVTNSATVEAPNTDDPDTDNNDATDDVDVQASADLSILKAATSALVVGSTATYTLTVTNAGPSQAQGVTIADPLPAGLTYVSASGTGWDCSASTATSVSCSLPSLAVATPSVVTLTVDVGAAAYPQVTNTATVASDTPDPDPGNNSDDETTTVPARVDLVVTKTHAATVVSVGDHLPYTLAVSNLGPTADPGPVTVTDTLPAGLTYISGTGDGWSCAATGQTVTCTRADLAVGAGPDIVLLVAVGPEAAPSVTNVASISSPALDVDPANNSDDDETPVRAVADLLLAKTLQTAVVAGEQVRYRLVVTNSGPSSAEGPIVVTDRLPSGLSDASASGTGWTCGMAAATLTCTRPGPLASGAAAPVIVLTATVTAASGTTLRNEASVSGVTYDPDPDNNAGAVAAQVLAADDLPHTGADVSRAVALGLMLLGLGLALVLASIERRRRV